MLPLESMRLRFAEVTADDLPALLAIYLSHPDFVAMSEGSQGQPAYYDLAMLQRDWWVQRMMPGSHLLRLDLKATGVVVGQANYLEENPSDGYPWLGLLMIDAAHQHQGLGNEALACLLDALRLTYSWGALRLGVLPRNTAALAFWEHHGFRVVERREQAIVMERAL